MEGEIRAKGDEKWGLLFLGGNIIINYKVPCHDNFFNKVNIGY